MKGYTLHIFTLPQCVHCNQLKGRLKEEGIKFNDFQADDPSLELTISNLERNLQTTTYPIINFLKTGVTKTILRKTNLEPSKNIIILDDIEEIIQFIKNEI